MKTRKLIVVVTLLAVFALIFSACGDGGNSGDTEYDPIVYTSYKGSDTYTLTITRDPNRAAFTPGTGDLYTLKITGSITATSTGTVSSNLGGILTLKHSSNIEFTVTISAGKMTNISAPDGSGNIPGTTVEAPDTLTPSDGDDDGGGSDDGDGNDNRDNTDSGYMPETEGLFTLTGADEFNGGYVWLSSASNYRNPDYLEGFKDLNQSNWNRKLVQITGGKAEIPVYIEDLDDGKYKPYNKSETRDYIEFFIYETEIVTNGNIKLNYGNITFYIGVYQVTFTNGKGTASVADAMFVTDLR